MASGYFPLGRTEKHDKIIEALSTLYEVIGTYGTIAHSACEQFDNSFDDGGYVAKFRLGLDLIQDALNINPEDGKKLQEIEDNAASKIR